MVIEKRLILKEELHIRRCTSAEQVRVPVSLRKQRAVIERIAADAHPTPTEEERMMDLPVTNSRHITAFFDDRSAAERAVEKLVSRGIPRDQIRLVSGYNTGGAGTRPSEVKGFWDSIADLFMPEEDRYTYAEGLRRGGFLVSVTVNENLYQPALDILDDEGTINMDEREAAWRSEGWTGYQGASSISGSQAAVSGGSTEERIPVVEEKLRVGKRDTSHGRRIRVRSYVVEEPVSEDIRLRDERVSVERRPVDRPASGGEELFKDRTIEMEEHREEAVVAKEARVKEEVVIRKKADERVEHVTEKVRRTNVEVEDERDQPKRQRTR